MKHSARLFAFLGPTLLVLAACSATPSGGGTDTGSTKPEGTTSQTCSGLTDCPSYACSCARGLINARRCINNYCLNAAATCADVCGTATKSDGGAEGDAGADVGAPADSGVPLVPLSVSADPCVPVSTSDVERRVGRVAAQIADHGTPPPTPSNGTVNVQRGTGGRVTRIDYDVAGSSDDYTEYLSYNSAGLLTKWDHDASNSSNDVIEYFSYNSAGLITKWDHDASNSSNDVIEYFSYNSAGLITKWDHDASNSSEDVIEDFSYNSAGLITKWDHDASNSSEDVIEYFSYDSSGRLTRWEYDPYSSSADASLTVSYSGSSSSVSANGSKATGAVVSKCP